MINTTQKKVDPALVLRILHRRYKEKSDLEFPNDYPAWNGFLKLVFMRESATVDIVNNIKFVAHEIAHNWWPNYIYLKPDQRFHIDGETFCSFSDNYFKNYNINYHISRHLFLIILISIHFSRASNFYYSISYKWDRCRKVNINGKKFPQ